MAESRASIRKCLELSMTLITEPAWRSNSPFFKNQAPINVRHWLADQGSLTQSLLYASHGNFHVEIFDQYWARPFFSEQKILQLKNSELVFIREVHLYCYNQAVVFARTVIPQNTLKGELQKLTQLGNRPLGAVLFANHKIQRGEMQTARITPNHALYNIALYHSEIEDIFIWGRRSVFYLTDKPLLVSEIFLPGIEHFK